MSTPDTNLCPGCGKAMPPPTRTAAGGMLFVCPCGGRRMVYLPIDDPRAQHQRDNRRKEPQ